MRRAKGVIFAFRPLGEPGQPAALTQRTDTITTAGKNFMGIGLMADIPYQPVVGGIEYVMQRHRQLDDAKTGAQMPARDGNRLNGLIANFVGKLFQIIGGEYPNIRRNFNPVQKPIGRLFLLFFRHQNSLTFEINTNFRRLLSPFYHIFGQVSQ